jgi:hypothetical protein
MAKRRTTKTSATRSKRAPSKRALALKRSLAAKKGWATRRADARLRKRGYRFARVKGKRVFVTQGKGKSLTLRKRKAPSSKPAYKNLAAFIAAYEAWDGDYDYYEIETSADY